MGKSSMIVVFPDHLCLRFALFVTQLGHISICFLSQGRLSIDVFANFANIDLIAANNTGSKSNFVYHWMLQTHTNP